MTGTETATLLILTSAVLHATWNALVKRAPDKFAAMVFVSGVGAAMFVPLVPLAPMPTPELWRWLVASFAIHFVYQLALAKALDSGDYTFVYPIARGLGPMLVGLFSYFALAGEISATELGAISVLVCGIFLCASQSRSALPQSPQAFGFAILTGSMIASYTIVDGLAVRMAGDPLTYVIWSSLGFAPILIGFGLWRRGPALLGQMKGMWKMGLPIAFIAQGGYAIALYAYSLGALGEIAALRETSILFALVIGVVWLRESVGKRRVIGALLIAIGAIALKAL